MKAFENKRIILTGSSSGIGHALLRYFIQEGAIVYASSRNEREITTKDKQECIFELLDLSNEKNVEKYIKGIIQKEDSIDILINNAANDERHEPGDVTPEYWEQQLRVNFSHHFFAAQAVKPEMAKAGGGAIINMGSISWHMALEFMPAYTSSKAAIEGLTQSLARAYGKEHIRVNCIIPGQVWTPRQIRDHLTPEYEQFMNEKQCLPGKILPEDIAQLALFLGSDAGRMCTRRNYFMDAGIGA